MLLRFMVTTNKAGVLMRPTLQAHPHDLSFSPRFQLLKGYTTPSSAAGWGPSLPHTGFGDT